MKACAALWVDSAQQFSQILLAVDREKQGEQLNDFLDSLSTAFIDGFLERMESGQKLSSRKPDGTFEISGLRFDFERKDSVLEVQRTAIS